MPSVFGHSNLSAPSCSRLQTPIYRQVTLCNLSNPLISRVCARLLVNQNFFRQSTLPRPLLCYLRCLLFNPPFSSPLGNPAPSPHQTRIVPRFSELYRQTKLFPQSTFPPRLPPFSLFPPVQFLRCPEKSFPPSAIPVLSRPLILRNRPWRRVAEDLNHEKRRQK